jgi:hypothetical protein
MNDTQGHCFELFLDVILSILIITLFHESTSEAGVRMSVALSDTNIRMNELIRDLFIQVTMPNVVRTIAQPESQVRCGIVDKHIDRCKRFSCQLVSPA